MRIAVIDYDVGNVRSILSAFDNQGVHALLTNDKKKILESDGVILPGVGAFKHGMDNLNKYGLVGTIILKLENHLWESVLECKCFLKRVRSLEIPWGLV